MDIFQLLMGLSKLIMKLLVNKITCYFEGYLRNYINQVKNNSFYSFRKPQLLINVILFLNLENQKVSNHM